MAGGGVLSVPVVWRPLATTTTPPWAGPPPPPLLDPPSPPPAPALASAARARLDHPEASLEEIAAILGLSKSGTNQRMRRLMALAAEAGLARDTSVGAHDRVRQRRRPDL